MWSKTEPGGYRPLEWPTSLGFTPECSTWNKSSFQYEKYGTGSSPGWTSTWKNRLKGRGGGVGYLSSAGQARAQPPSTNRKDSWQPIPLPDHRIAGSGRYALALARKCRL